MAPEILTAYSLAHWLQTRSEPPQILRRILFDSQLLKQDRRLARREFFNAFRWGSVTVPVFQLAA